MRVSASSFWRSATCRYRCSTVGTVSVLCSLSHGDRVAQMPVGDAPDLARHGRREERRLARAGHLSQDPLDVVDEPHPQHLVGLVEHDGLRDR